MSTKQDRRQRFIDVFPGIRDELIEYLANENMPNDAQEWYRNVRLHAILPYGQRVLKRPKTCLELRL